MRKRRRLKRSWMLETRAEGRIEPPPSERTQDLDGKVVMADWLLVNTKLFSDELGTRVVVLWEITTTEEDTTYAIS